MSSVAGTASVELPDDGHQCRAADPEAAPFVAEQISPASGTRGATRCVAAVGDRARSGDDDDACGVAGPGDQRHQRVVDDDDLAP